MIMAASVAPVRDFALQQLGDRIVGYAAPASGSLPAGVILTVNGVTLFAARATRHSAEAATQSVRLGWCGFEIHGAARAFALGDGVELACAASGASLQSLDIRTMSRTPAAAAQETVSVADLLGRVRSADTCATPAPILPFAESYRARTSLRELLEASHMMVLKRPVSHEAEEWVRQHKGEPSPAALLDMLVRTEEFRHTQGSYIPGPFHPDFRYGPDPFA